MAGAQNQGAAKTLLTSFVTSFQAAVNEEVARLEKNAKFAQDLNSALGGSPAANQVVDYSSIMDLVNGSQMNDNNVT